MHRFLPVLLLVAAFIAQPASAHRKVAPAWYSCLLHLDRRTSTRVVPRTCKTHAMPRHHRSPTGWWIDRTLLSPHIVHSVRYPRFATSVGVQTAGGSYTPAAGGSYAIWLYVTGYSWGCGTPNGVTASGTVPAVGTVASDVLALGTHVYVPSLGYSGVVLDRGAPLDLFAPDCAATYGYTGWREVEVSP